MLSNKFTILLFSLIILNNLYTQVQQEWLLRFNGSANSFDAGQCCTIDNLGNIIIGGSSSTAQNFRDFITVKYNPSGVLLWMQTYNGPGNSEDYILSIESDNSGNIYVLGRSRGNGTGDDYATIKYNSNGIQQWVQRYNGGGGGDDDPNRILVDDSSNVYITGRSQQSFGGIFHIATVKYNKDGVFQWANRISGEGGDSYGWDAILDNQNNIYVTGFLSELFTGASTVLVKYDKTGNPLWLRKYSGETEDTEEARSVSIDNLGNVYISGYSWSLNNGPDFLTIKYDSSGNQKWVKTYNGPGNNYDWANKIIVDNQNNIYVTGFISVLNPISSDIATIKYDSLGNELWVRTYNGPGNNNEFPTSIDIDNLGNIYVAGSSNNSNNLSDYVSIKYDPQGNEKWALRYNGPTDSSDMANSIVVDNENNVYVTGSSRGSGSSSDIVTIKYSQPIGIISNSNGQPKYFALEQNYPNPFNPHTYIGFQIQKRGYVKLTIFDIRGRSIESLVNQVLSNGFYKVQWDGSNMPSGIYYYNIRTDQFNETKKMVLLK